MAVETSLSPRSRQLFDWVYPTSRDPSWLCGFSTFGVCDSHGNGGGSLSLKIEGITLTSLTLVIPFFFVQPMISKYHFAFMYILYILVNSQNTLP